MSDEWWTCASCGFRALGPAKEERPSGWGADEDGRVHCRNCSAPVDDVSTWTCARCGVEAVADGSGYPVRWFDEDDEPVCYGCGIEPRLREMEEGVRWLAQTVHQVHHDGALETCEKSTCAHARRLLNEDA